MSETPMPWEIPGAPRPGDYKAASGEHITSEDEEFAPRQLVIAHKEVWDGIVQWAKEHKLTVIEVPPEDPDDLPFSIFVPEEW